MRSIRPALFVLLLLAISLAAAGGDRPRRVWVMFHDKGVGGGERTAALAAAEAALHPRARERRARIAAPGAALVDERDLPLSADHVAAVESTGAAIVHASRWLNAVSCRADAGQISRLRRLPCVAEVRTVARGRRAAVPDPLAHGPLARPRPRPAKDGLPDYGLGLEPLTQLNVPAAHARGLTGAGVVVGVLDTGFRTTHASLDHIPVLAAWDFVENDAVVDFEAGDVANVHHHGTEALSNIAAHDPGGLVAPAWGVSVILARTEALAFEHPVEEDHWVAGLEWVEGLGADIVSSSLGYVDWYTYEDLDGDTAVTTIAADLAAARGLIIVDSAGNDRASTGHLIAPADADSIITVGAVDSLGDVTWFSSPGPTVDGRIKPDVAARGLYNPAADPDDPAAYVSVSGTSFSCPLVTGVAALVLQRVPDLDPLEMREALTMTASQAGTPDNDLGWGIVDALAAARWFGPVHGFAGLPDTVQAGREVAAEITARLGVAPATAKLVYRVDGGPWQLAALVRDAGSDSFRTPLPLLPEGVPVDYYLQASDLGGHPTVWPATAPDGPLTLTVRPGTSAVGDTAPPATISQLGNAPNPFNPRTEISFRLGRAGHVRVSVLDPRGMLVRDLLTADLAAGRHTVVWDGRDGADRPVASGAYFYRVASGDHERAGRMLLVR